MSVAAGYRPRLRRIMCFVRAICALRFKGKPRPRVRSREARPLRPPRGAVALELLLWSSAENIMSRALVSCRGDLVRYNTGVKLRFLL